MSQSPARRLFPVTCERHGPRPCGYTVCLCVARAFTPVATFIPARPARLGQVLCDPNWTLKDSGKKKIHTLDQHGAIEVVLMCDLCVKEQGLDKIGGMGGGAGAPKFDPTKTNARVG